MQGWMQSVTVSRAGCLKRRSVKWLHQGGEQWGVCSGSLLPWLAAVGTGPGEPKEGGGSLGNVDFGFERESAAGQG